MKIHPSHQRTETPWSNEKDYKIKISDLNKQHEINLKYGRFNKGAEKSNQTQQQLYGMEDYCFLAFGRRLLAVRSYCFGSLDYFDIGEGDDARHPQEIHFQHSGVQVVFPPLQDELFHRADNSCGLHENLH